MGRRDDLRSTAESIRQDAATVAALESEKLALQPGDPRVDRMSRRVEELLGQMTDKAAAERALAAEIDDHQRDNGSSR